MQEPTLDKEENPWVENTPLNLAEMDRLIEDMVQAKEVYAEAKKLSGEKYSEYRGIEHKVLLALKAAGKKSYKVDNLGTFSIVSKNVINVPKDLEDKRAMFGWIHETYGQDVLDEMRSIHSGKLTSFYNEEYEKCENKALFEIPGIGSPTTTESTRFTKAKT